ncbi:hypothetical protein EJ06DRAFT_389473 [Trichodelitschia bisporula]|uniref:Glutaredoxin-like protein n=1 Tax=Trichodelitschia bisporula TaxID=703511 RepID=A0A6G1HZS9_9PEZI|nr:hypothetical protein EJ06DRAFT_389473 [Trichodelitschia bisporula]
MRPAAKSLARVCHITLFTRANCSLCDDAKTVLSKVWDKRPFHYREIDVMTPEASKWKIYEFDTPVIHVEKLKGAPEDFGTTTAARKLMHRFKAEQVEGLMDEVEKER